jgi:hypothetical protein
LRAGLEALGFRLLGAAVRVLPTDADAVALAAKYEPADGEAMLRGDRLAQVMVAPDGTAFVRMAWFWAGTYAEVSTVLPDGRVVTTALDWGIDPAWPRRMRRQFEATTDRRREQELWWAPSTSLRLVEGGAAELWAAHRAHVAAVHGAAAVPVHARLADAVGVYDAAQACRMRAVVRSSRLAAVVALVIGAVLLVASHAILRPTFGWGLLLGMPATLLVLAVFQPLWLRCRHRRWLYPVLRAPVPGR